MDPIKVPVLLGPTASGKTACALYCSEELGLEIISCDSRQIYKYMDIGTAKPSRDMQNKVKHWLIDIADPSEPYSAFRFSQDASAIIRQRARQGARTMICGGTGLYFQALHNGLGPFVSHNPAIREKYTLMARELGNDSVFERLKAVDPATAASSHAANLVRNIRALEVFETANIPFSQLKKSATPPVDIEFLICILALDRENLYNRINQRVDAMFGAGLINEFYGLLNQGYSRESPGLLCVGYRELFDVVGQNCSLERATDLVKQNTRHYAKRQLTWFRHQVKGIVFDAMQPDAFASICRSIKAFFNE